jgi:UDP-N-acetyl-D-mannosaminuronic acid transferase (WecB/TagA/CpsF family)
MDFFLNKKKHSPKFFTKLGIEWLYRLITDFRITKKKAWRSFVAIKYLGRVRLI